MRKRPSRLAMLLAMALVCLPTALAWAMKKGDFLVADRSRGLILVDASGATQSLLTGVFNSGGFVDVANDATGNIYAVTDGAHGAFVVRVDPNTAAMSVVTSGGHLQYPRSVDLAPNGELYVVEGGPVGALVRVDPSGGMQTVVVSGVIPGSFTLVSDTIGYLMIAEGTTSWYLYRIDLASGDTTRISNTAIHDPRGLATEASGKLIVSEYYTTNILRMDPIGGGIAPLSGGGPFMTPWGVAVEDDGTIVMADNQGLYSCHPPPPTPSRCHGALFRVDPVSGTKTIVSEQGIFSDITGVDVYHGPTTTAIRNATWGSVKTKYR